MKMFYSQRKKRIARMLHITVTPSITPMGSKIFPNHLHFFIFRILPKFFGLCLQTISIHLHSRRNTGIHVTFLSQNTTSFSVAHRHTVALLIICRSLHLLSVRRTSKNARLKSALSYALSIAQKDRQPQKATGVLDHFSCRCVVLSSSSSKTESPYFWIILARNSAHFSIFTLACFSVNLPVLISSIFPIIYGHLLLI